jgi:hypothetical protein
MIQPNWLDIVCFYLYLKNSKYIYLCNGRKIFIILDIFLTKVLIVDSFYPTGRVLSTTCEQRLILVKYNIIYLLPKLRKFNVLIINNK